MARSGRRSRAPLLRPRPRGPRLVHRLRRGHSLIRERALPTWRPFPADPADWFTADELDRARRYQTPLSRLRIVRSVAGLGLFAAFMFGRVGPRLFDWLDLGWWVPQLLVLALVMQVVSLLYDVPLDAWVDLRHDRTWGLSTQTARGLAADHVKSFVLEVVVFAAVLVPLYAVIRATSWWWILGWLMLSIVTVGFGVVYPVLIAPIFNTFTPLPEGELLERIRKVARLAGVTIEGAYVADASRRSRRDNAYVAGLGRTRRVVLFDTLLEHPVEIVEQVVAHEIGHWQRNHLRLSVLASFGVLLLAFAGLRVASEWTWLFERAGADPVRGFGDPAALPMLLLLVQLGMGVVGLAGSWLSRALEREADLSALQLLDDPQRLVAMHRSLHVKNLADLDPGWWRRLNTTHPPAAQRMAFAAAWPPPASEAASSAPTTAPAG